MTSSAERARRLYNVSRGDYLTEEEDAKLIELNWAYDKILNEDGVNFSGIHQPSLEKAFEQVPGSRETWQKWHETMEGLTLSGKF